MGFQNIQFWNGGNMVATLNQGKWFSSKQVDRWPNNALETALKAWVPPA